MKLTLANPMIPGAPRPTTERQRWLYALANLSCAIPYQAVGAVILFFYADVRHLNPLWAAGVMTAYSIYNAINNPLMGYLSDRTRTRWGRRIPYILFGGLPYALFFAVLFLAPFDGKDQPVALLIYFAAAIFLFESLATIVQTAYYALLPEMFRDYQERTDVAVRMNIFMTVGLLMGAALPLLLAKLIGWPWMACLLAVITLAGLVIGLRGMVESSQSVEAENVSLRTALRATLVNRSFVTIVVAQTMRHFSTATLSAGMAFYTKYSLKADEGLSSLILAAAFISAALALWPWKRFVANRFGPRTTLMAAYVCTGLAVIPLGTAASLTGAFAASVLVGIALAGLLLMGDVTLADVIDEDQVRTGQRREGMYFGMSGLIVTIAYALSAQVFGWVSKIFGYDPLLAVQPAQVAEGFRFLMVVPPLIGAVLAVITLYFYPLHGERLEAVKKALAEAPSSNQPTGQLP